MLDRRSQSPMAASQKMGTARAIFDGVPEQEPVKRLTRSIRNPTPEPLSTDQKSFTYQQPGMYLPQDANSPNSRQYTQENFEYRKPETENVNFRTVQTYKPQEVNAQPTTQFDYSSFDYKKPDAGRTGSYIQPAYNTTFQEPKTYQTTYEPPKYEKTFDKYEVNTFDKYKTTYDQPKSYEKFEQYKFDPSKYDFNVPEQPKEFQPSYSAVPIQKNSIITTTYQIPEKSTYQIPEKTTLDTQFNRAPLNQPVDISLSIPRKTEEPIRSSEIYTMNQQPNIPKQQIQYPPSQKAESIRQEIPPQQSYRPTTFDNPQQSVKPIETQKNYDPVQINYKPSYKTEIQQAKYTEEILIVENEANEPEFNAGCNIF